MRGPSFLAIFYTFLSSRLSPHRKSSRHHESASGRHRSRVARRATLSDQTAASEAPFRWGPKFDPTSQKAHWRRIARRWAAGNEFFSPEYLHEKRGSAIWGRAICLRDLGAIWVGAIWGRVICLRDLGTGFVSKPVPKSLRQITRPQIAPKSLRQIARPQIAGLYSLREADWT